jgi:NAD-dependent dihydropyrimidine dehydrogenase PreA subunit
MNLDVHAMCQTGHILHDECILCGSCVDACSSSCIGFSFSNPHKEKMRR